MNLSISLSVVCECYGFNIRSELIDIIVSGLCVLWVQYSKWTYPYHCQWFVSVMGSIFEVNLSISWSMVCECYGFNIRSELIDIMVNGLWVLWVQFFTYLGSYKRESLYWSHKVVKSQLKRLYKDRIVFIV